MNLITRCRRLVDRLNLGRSQKFVVAVVGGSVMLVGIAMLVLPGPAILVIPLGAMEDDLPDQLMLGECQNPGSVVLLITEKYKHKRKLYEYFS